MAPGDCSLMIPASQNPHRVWHRHARRGTRSATRAAATNAGHDPSASAWSSIECRHRAAAADGHQHRPRPLAAWATGRHEHVRLILDRGSHGTSMGARTGPHRPPVRSAGPLDCRAGAVRPASFTMRPGPGRQGAYRAPTTPGRPSRAAEPPYRRESRARPRAPGRLRRARPRASPAALPSTSTGHGRPAACSWPSTSTATRPGPTTLRELPL